MPRERNLAGKEGRQTGERGSKVEIAKRGARLQDEVEVLREPGALVEEADGRPSLEDAGDEKAPFAQVPQAKALHFLSNDQVKGKGICAAV